MEPRADGSQTGDPKKHLESDPDRLSPQEFPGTEQDMELKPDHGYSSYKGSRLLEGRKALITGGDSGIGKAVALAFAREGADVAISYLNSKERADADEIARWVGQAGRRCLLLEGDIQDEKQCVALVSKTVAEFGGLDLLINNAAYQQEYSSIEDVSTEDFETTFRTNVFAMFWLSKAALRVMKPGSSIINTASIQAYEPSEGLLAYAPTKAAIVNFTKALAKSAMKNGVRVNCVAPGPVLTPLIPATLTPDHVRRFGENTTLERPAQPVEISPLFVFLASNHSTYLTGEVLGATGGRSPF